jgi:hypothetical protein
MLGNGRPFYQNLKNYYGIRILLQWFRSGGKAPRGKAATRGLGTSGDGLGRTPFGPYHGGLALQSQPEILSVPGLFWCLPTTIWRPHCRTLCTPLYAFMDLFVSGFIFSMFSALAGEKSVFQPFVFSKFSA